MQYQLGVGHDATRRMHPSDSRMAGWGLTTFTIGDAVGNFPAYQWKDVNNPTTVKFTLGQAAAHTVRIGISAAYAGGPVGARAERCLNERAGVTFTTGCATSASSSTRRACRPRTCRGPGRAVDP